jgi:acetyltransferase
LVRFSRLVVEQPWVKEIDINPFLASPERLLALDARVVLHGAGTREDQLPRPAIRPYPAQYIGEWNLPDGDAVTIRPIRPEDEPAVARFHSTLSKDSVYYRYFHVMGLSQRTGHEQLVRVCFLDYEREVALVAERTDPANKEHSVIALGQLIKLFGTDAAEAAVLVSDALQGQGLGTEMTRRLLSIAKVEKIRRVTADILPENHLMQQICRRLGFSLRALPQEQVIRAELVLGAS